MKLNYTEKGCASIPLTRLQVQGVFLRLQDDYRRHVPLLNQYTYDPGMSFGAFVDKNQIEIVEDPDDSDARYL